MTPKNETNWLGKAARAGAAFSMASAFTATACDLEQYVAPEQGTAIKREAGDEFQTVANPDIELFVLVPLLPGNETVPVREKPSVSSKIVREAPTTVIYGTRVLGGKYPDSHGNVSVKFPDGRELGGGQWIKITDERGQRQGGFVASARVAKITPSTENTPTKEELEAPATLYYPGTILIKKGVAIRTEPKITKSEHPTETNAVPWERIVRINGIDVSRVSEFLLDNPLAVIGDDPTGGTRFYGKEWLLVIVEFLEEGSDGQRKIVKRALFINVSIHTKDHVTSSGSPVEGSKFVPRTQKQDGNAK